MHPVENRDLDLSPTPISDAIIELVNRLLRATPALTQKLSPYFLFGCSPLLLLANKFLPLQ
jgi:hypothetical protein